MYRVNGYGKQYYAMEIDISRISHRKEIEVLIEEGEPLILTEDLEGLEILGIEMEQIKILERE